MIPYPLEWYNISNGTSFISKEHVECECLQLRGRIADKSYRIYEASVDKRIWR